MCTKELHINYNDVKVLIVLTEGFPFFYVWAFHQLYSLVWHFSKIDKSRPCLILFVDLYLESSNNSMLLDRWPRISVQRTLKWYGYWTEFLFAIQSFILHWHARAVARSENRGGGTYYWVGIMCPPRWDRVNWSAKKWGPLAPTLATGL